MAYKQSGFPMHAGVSPMKKKKESKTYEENKAKGVYTKQGRSHTPGPVVGSVFDTDPNETKTSKKIGPVENPEVIKKKRAKVTKTENEKGVFSKESMDASDDLSSSTDYVKR